MTKRERERLEELRAKEEAEKEAREKQKRAFRDSCKREFGMSPREIHALIDGQKAAENAAEQAKESDGKTDGDYSEIHDKKVVEFFEKVTTFYALHSEADREKWLSVMLNEQSRSFWMRSGKPAERRVT